MNYIYMGNNVLGFRYKYTYWFFDTLYIHIGIVYIPIGIVYIPIGIFIHIVLILCIYIDVLIQYMIHLIISTSITPSPTRLYSTPNISFSKSPPPTPSTIFINPTRIARPTRASVHPTVDNTRSQSSLFSDNCVHSPR